MKSFLFSIAHKLSSVGLILTTRPELVYNSFKFAVVLSEVLEILQYFLDYLNQESWTTSVILFILKIWKSHDSGNVIHASEEDIFLVEN